MTYGIFYVIMSSHTANFMTKATLLLDEYPKVTKMSIYSMKKAANIFQLTL